MFSTKKSFEDTINKHSGQTFNEPLLTEKEKRSAFPRTAAVENRAIAQLIALVQGSEANSDLLQAVKLRMTD